MNAKNFMLTLRKVIREEVRAAVRQEVKQLLESNQKAPLTKTTKQVPNQKRHSPVLFDGPLSSILNETAESMYSAQNQEEWQDMSETLTADKAQGFGLSALMNQNTSVDNFTPSNLTGDPTSAFVKDYSAVMKAADKFSKR